MKKQVIASSSFLWKMPKANTVWDQISALEPLAPPYLDEAAAMRLYEERLVDSEVVYGTIVEVLKEVDGWSQVLVLDQASDLDERGYPGYLASAHLTSVPEKTPQVYGNIAVVVAETRLHLQNGEERAVLFGTVLPYIREEATYFRVQTPEGQARIAQSAVHKIGADGQVARMIRHARNFLALPYVWAGTSSCGFDCSGLMYALHRTEGLLIPRDAEEQAAGGLEIAYSAAKPGDLLLFAYEEGKGAVHHVGMYLGADQMIHSETPGSEVKIGPILGTKFEKELCTVRRYWQH